MRAVTILCCLLAVVGASATTARADTAPFADTGLPWTDPNHRSPLEVLGSSIVSTIAKQDVAIRCQGDNDWQILAVQRGFDTARVWGYVGTLVFRNGVIHSIANFAQISPQACLALHQFAVAPVKPTKCSVPRSVTVTTTRVVTERVRVRVPIVKTVRGRRVRTTELRWRTIRKSVPVQTTKTEAGAPAPCFAGDVRGNPGDEAYWNQYLTYARALQTLAHEAIHLGGMVGGTTADGVPYGYPDDEARAECWGMQWLPYVAEQLGAAPDDARAIARFYATTQYPRREHSAPEYWSAECRDGGALDLHPETTLWP